MGGHETGTISLEVLLSLEDETVNGVIESITQIPDALQEQLERVWEVFDKQAGEYVAATAKDMSVTWDKTQKDLKSITANALSGTVTALFKGDMDDVGDIWESAWDSMIDKADSLWSGFLNKTRRLPCSRINIKGPEVFPGALSFKRAA